MIADDVSLTPEERKLFEDPSIEAAYQAWMKANTGHSKPVFTRKSFLIRLKELLSQELSP